MNAGLPAGCHPHNHRIAADDPQQRFDLAAPTYDGTRPGYPAVAIEWLVEQAGLERGAHVLDLGAGTGLLSRALAERGLEVVAAEPNSAMRQKLVANSAGVKAIAAGAEETGLAADSLALVTAGQAYHWFELPRALPEIHRVLAGEGHFAVLWIRPEVSDPLQLRLEGLASTLMAEACPPGAMPDQPLRWERWFEPVAFERFPFTWDFGEASLADYVASFSVVATLEASERAELLAEVAGWAPGGEGVRLRFNAEIHLARARPAPEA